MAQQLLTHEPVVESSKMTNENQPDGFAEYHAYFATIFDESDSGFILLAIERLDDLLTDLHRTFIELNTPSENKDFLKKLLKWPGPLSSFATRVALARAYALISKDDYQILQCLREIRNAAAHPDKPFRKFKFGNPEVWAMVRQIKINLAESVVNYGETEKRSFADYERTIKSAEDIQATIGPNTPEDSIRIYILFAVEHVAARVMVRVHEFLQRKVEILKSLQP